MSIPISMDESRRKLMRLSEELPGIPAGAGCFAEILADGLNPRLSPEGFILLAEEILYDAEDGLNALAGYPPVVYRALRAGLPVIASAVFPEEFAEAVKRLVG